MRRLVTPCFALALALFALTVYAQDAAAPLQGRWVVTGGEHNAKPMNALNGGVMTISGNAFEIRTASGNMLKGTLRLDASKQPAQMDMIHADGVQWEAIYEATADTLRLNYVVKGEKDPRPAAFTTSDRTEESIVILQREKR
jgi:uncharacterized protein (TIGR03067 family)